MNCLYCGTPIPTKGATGHERKFCSTTCKAAAWAVASRWGMWLCAWWAKRNGLPLSKAPETPDGCVGGGK